MAPLLFAVIMLVLLWPLIVRIARFRRRLRYAQPPRGAPLIHRTPAGNTRPNMPAGQVPSVH